MEGSSTSPSTSDADVPTGTSNASESSSGSSTGLSVIEVTPPCGIFLLGTDRDVPWVSGSLATLMWKDAEPTTPGVYDFTFLRSQIRQGQPGHRVALRMTGTEPDHIVAGADETWIWIDPNPERDTCRAPEGCPRPTPWDRPSLDRYALFVEALAAETFEIDGLSLPLREHPRLSSVMLTLPGWGRIRELGFEVEQLPGYSRAKVIDATMEALRVQTEAFPNTPVFTQFFEIDDGDDPPLWQAMRDAILADPTLASVGFYQENMAHSDVDGVETFRPAPDFAEVLFSSQDLTFIGLQALGTWVMPNASHTEQLMNGSPVAAMAWALETYGTRYFELYAPDVDAAIDGTQPEWLPEYEALAARLCP